MNSELERKCEEQRKEIEAYKTLSELQDKLLICYRVGRNPGSILDKLAVAREKVARFSGGEGVNK